MISKENFVTTNADVRLADWALPKFDRIEKWLSRSRTSKPRNQTLYIPPFTYLRTGRVAEYLYGTYGLTLSELEGLSCKTSEALLNGAFVKRLRSDYFEEKIDVLGSHGMWSIFPCDIPVWRDVPERGQAVGGFACFNGRSARTSATRLSEQGRTRDTKKTYRGQPQKGQHSSGLQAALAASHQ